MSSPRVMGLDLSLTETGYALSGNRVGRIRPGKRRGMERLLWLRAQVMTMVQENDQHIVYIEGYSFSSRNSHAHGLGELGGVIRLSLYERGIPYVDVPPSSLKKYATGKGNARKELVLVEAVKRLEYPGANDNEADALWLRALGMEHQGSPTVEVPKVHRKALEKIGDPITR